MLHVIKMQFERELYMYMGVYICVCIYTYIYIYIYMEKGYIYIYLEKGMATHSRILAFRIPRTDHGIAKCQTQLSD